jgi:enediyne biosynthesis protein E4
MVEEMVFNSLRNISRLTIKGCLILFVFLILISCTNNKKKLFKLVGSEETGIVFKNRITESSEFNIFNYMYFYNGAGVAIGDVNGDNLSDIYFTSNQQENMLYLNQGNFRFKDVTKEAGVAGSGGWSTGVTMADVNGDGLLDIYVCYVNDFWNTNSKNQLFINKGLNEDGIPIYVDEAQIHGLDFKGLSTQAVFFDYDNDMDLDMFLLNHSLHMNGTFGPANELRRKIHARAGDKLFKNENGKFVDVTFDAGIFSSPLGYGLGVAVSDVNLDGFLDIYVGNDFHENDYLYINQGNGKFINKIDESVNHTSRYTMGVDLADFNNDAFPDIITMDMLPQKYEWQKSSAAEDPYETYLFKKSFGYNEQYTRNALQLNNGNGTFSEIGIFAGVHATDWSWATFFADFDLDGDKDLFVSNGIRRRSNDLDYINFISNDSVQKNLGSKHRENELRYITRMPEIKISNLIFSNNNDSTFTDSTIPWGINRPSYSNGAAYADLDNDGDLDLVINNIDEPAFVYENQILSSQGEPKDYIRIKLIGNSPNTFGIGSKVFVYSNGVVQMQESLPTKGFQSSVDTRLTFGLSSKIDSLIVVWSDRTFQHFSNLTTRQELSVKQSNANGIFDYSRFHQTNFIFNTLQSPTFSKHIENRFPEFDKEILIPFMLSAEGPAVAVGDINNDGKEDIFLGGAKWQPARIYLQQSDGNFKPSDQLAIKNDSTFEDVDASFFDVDADNDLDLIVISGGNEFDGNSKFSQPRLYRNDGNGNFSAEEEFPSFPATGARIATCDFDKDGDIDVFIGGRAIAGKYGLPCDSYILSNNGKGRFTNITKSVAPDLYKLGMLKDACWADLDNNGFEDLIVALEWQPLRIFYNDGNTLSERKHQELPSGLWSSIIAYDFDSDGDMDLVAGNLGLNSKLKANDDEPLKLYVNDFDSNGTIEQIVTQRVNNKEYIVSTRDELTKQIPALKKKFLSYKKFAEAELKDFFDSKLLENSIKYEVNSLVSIYLENNDGRFREKELPKAIQFSTLNTMIVTDFNNDKKPDLMAGGNFFGSNIQMGRYDASFGNLLMGYGNGSFKVIPGVKSGISFSGEIRKIVPVNVSGQNWYLVIRNNEVPKFLTLIGRN